MKLVFCALGLLIYGTVHAADRRPNVLLLLGDDLGYGDVGFDGRAEWQTPNLDRLAGQGTTFRRWYTAAVVCAPSRAALLTGRYSIHNGVTGNHSLDLPSEEVTIAEVLRESGYVTGLFGKWHHGAPRPGSSTYTHPMDQGFDEFFGFTDAVHAWQKFPTELFDGRELKPSKGYADTLFTTRAIDFITRHKDQPFFCYVPYIATHGQVGAPPEDIAEHRGKLPELDPAKPLNATYAAEVTRLDKEVGRLMKTLEDLKLADNTIVIFSSDHGATFEKLAQGTSAALDSNHPFRGQKRTLWEGGMRVPAVVCWPGHVPAGAQSHQVIYHCDIFPTLLAAAGAATPTTNSIDGRNVLDAWLGKAAVPQRMLCWEWREGGDTQLAVMRGNLKLIITGGNRPELYDVEADPAERINIAADHAEEAAQMGRAIDEWLATEMPAAREKKKNGKSDHE
jgi:arylsulfatase A-like enzyme